MPPDLHGRDYRHPQGSGVAGGEVPVDLALVVVGGVLAGSQFGVEDAEVADAPVQALAGEGGQFDLVG
jgi:hypothetical protein